MKTSWTAGIYYSNQPEIGAMIQKHRPVQSNIINQPIRHFEHTNSHSQKRRRQNEALESFVPGIERGWKAGGTHVSPKGVIDLSWASIPPKAQHAMDPKLHWANSEATTGSATIDNVTCNICHKTFSSKSGLYYHKRLHNEGKFRCIYCQRGFTRRVLMNQHVAKIHPDKAYQYFSTLNRSKHDRFK